jgi:hypothetical protein
MEEQKFEMGLVLREAKEQEREEEVAVISTKFHCRVVGKVFGQ